MTKSISISRFWIYRSEILQLIHLNIFLTLIFTYTDSFKLSTKSEHLVYLNKKEINSLIESQIDILH